MKLLDGTNNLNLLRNVDVKENENFLTTPLFVVNAKVIVNMM